MYKFLNQKLKKKIYSLQNEFEKISLLVTKNFFYDFFWFHEISRLAFDKVFSKLILSTDAVRPLSLDLYIRYPSLYLVHATDQKKVLYCLSAGSPPLFNFQFSRSVQPPALGKVLRRPTLLPIPKPALWLRLGRELTQELLYASQRVEPTVLSDRGYEFIHTDVEGALRAARNRPA